MAFTKITEEDMRNKGVVGLPDTPGFTTAEMQRKFDEIATDVIVPKHNKLVDELNAPGAIASIGGGAISAHMQNRQNPHGVTAEQVGAYTKQAVGELIDQKITEVGAGDMSKAEYGGSAPGIVREADKAKLAVAAEETQMFRCTFGLDWADTGGKWEQTVDCAGMKASYNTDAPEFEPTAVQSTNEKLMEVLNILNAGKLETLDGQIHATVFEQPQSEIDVILRRAVYPEVI